jgi:hypothetical protein
VLVILFLVRHTTDIGFVARVAIEKAICVCVLTSVVTELHYPYETRSRLRRPIQVKEAYSGFQNNTEQAYAFVVFAVSSPATCPAHLIILYLEKRNFEAPRYASFSIILSLPHSYT